MDVMQKKLDGAQLYQAHGQAEALEYILLQ